MEGSKSSVEPSQSVLNEIAAVAANNRQRPSVSVRNLLVNRFSLSRRPRPWRLRRLPSTSPTCSDITECALKSLDFKNGQVSLLLREILTRVLGLVAHKPPTSAISGVSAIFSAPGLPVGPSAAGVGSGVFRALNASEGAANLCRWAILQLIEVSQALGALLLAESDCGDLLTYYSFLQLNGEDKHLPTSTVTASETADCKSRMADISEMLSEVFKLLITLLDLMFLSLLPMCYASSEGRMPRRDIRNLNFSFRRHSLSRPPGLRLKVSSKASLKLRSLSTARRVDRRLSRGVSTHSDVLTRTGIDVPLAESARTTCRSDFRRRFTSNAPVTAPELSWLVGLIERCMVYGAGISSLEGIWDAGMLLKLSMIQMINSRPRLGLACLDQVLCITEGGSFTPLSRILKGDILKALDKSVDHKILATDEDRILLNQRFLHTSGVEHLHRSRAYLYLLKGKTLINQVQDFEAAIECLKRFSDTYKLDVDDETSIVLLGRVKHLLGVGLLCHALSFPPGCSKYEEYVEAARCQLKMAVSQCGLCWKVCYHLALACCYGEDYVESLEYCKQSLVLYSGYPGSWVLLAAIAGAPSKENHKGEVNRSRLHSAAFICVKQGEEHCRFSSFLLLMVLLTTVRSYITTEHAFFTMRHREPTKAAVDVRHEFVCTAREFLTAGESNTAILNHLDSDDVTEVPLTVGLSSCKRHEGSTSPISSPHHICTQSKESIHEVHVAIGKLVQKLLPSDMSPPGEPTTQSVLIMIDRMDDEELLLLLRTSTNVTLASDKAALKAGGNFNYQRLDDMSLGRAIRAEMSGQVKHSSRSHYDSELLSGLSPVFTSQPRDSNPIDIIHPFSKSPYREDHLRIDRVLISIAELLCDFGELQMAEEVLCRAGRLVSFACGGRNTEDWIEYEVVQTYMLFCQVMTQIQCTDTINMKEDNNRMLIQLFAPLRLKLFNIVNIHPFCRRAMQMDAAVMLCLGDISGALNVLRRCLQLNSSDVRTLTLLSEAQVRSGLLEDALDSLETIAEIERHKTVLPYEWLPIYIM